MGQFRDEDTGLRSYLQAIERHDVLDRVEELKLAEASLVHHDAQAAERLVTCNLRHVARIAFGFRGYGIRLADLIEEGNVGLLEAQRRFDPTRKLRFMTYASYWIRAYIYAHVLKQSTLVGIGTGPLQSKLFFRLGAERARITAELGDEVNAPEVERRLATKFGTSVERIRDLGGRLGAKDVSLDAQLFQDGNATAMDRLADEHDGADGELDDLRRKAEVQRRLAVVMKSLPEREQYIVEQRLLGDEDVTLAEIGRHLHISRERVRQLETRVKDKLKRAFHDMEPNLTH